MKKALDLLRKFYGFLLCTSFFGGIVPLIPFVIAIILGGTTGEAIAIFLYKQVYPIIIAIGSASILAGLACTYLEKFIQKSTQSK